MPKRYTSRKRTYRKKSRKITRFRRYRTGTRAKAKSYFRLRRAAKTYTKSRKIRRAKKQYKYTAGKGVKNKIKHLTMAQFAQLPIYDLARISSLLSAGQTPNMYDNITGAIRDNFDTQMANTWFKLGAILPEQCFNVSSPFVIGDNSAYSPFMYAFNPILSPVTCGSKMQLYAALYKKFKYVGIKVTWHPRVRTTTFIIPSKLETTPAQKDNGNFYQDTYYGYGNLDGGVNIQLPINDEGADGVMLDPGSMKHKTEVKKYDVVSSQTLYMHVYFGKQLSNTTYWNMPYLRKINEANGQTTYDIVSGFSPNDQQRRVKAAQFFNYNTMMPCIEKDSKLHKIYDMSKPFSFFVRPMVSSTDVAHEAAADVTNEVAEMNQPGNHPLENLAKGLKHLGYREFNHTLTSAVLDIPQDQTSDAFKHNPQHKYYDRWALLSNDDNYFNPIMFWYCFTTSDSYEPTNNYYRDQSCPHQLFNSVYYNPSTGPNANAKRELSSSYAPASSALNNYGYFDVTFYTKWKEERPLVSKTEYIGIVPTETGVDGLSSIL